MNTISINIPSTANISYLMSKKSYQDQYEIGFDEAMRNGRDGMNAEIKSNEDLPYLFGYICGLSTLDNEITEKKLFPDLNCESFNADF